MATKIIQGDTPTNANRNQRRRQRTRETILAAAELVFRRKGIDGTTVNDITEQADVAYGSFYNHFKSIDEIVGALVAASLQRVADRTGSILEKAERVELLPCVGARVIMRTLWQDPAIRWLLGRPYVFVDEFYKVATPAMVSFERQAVEAGVLRPAGGHDYWLKVYPWILIAELTALAETGNIAEHEERFARVSLRLLGVDDALAPGLIARSRELISESGIPEPKVRGSRRTKSTAAS
ncbi:helix-turn-helix domain containing protein [Bradyrhizobium sp. SSUT18]|uniref:TetR/AcrR family transcriptional regulator n=1 Tax=Bradyrhizobium sp. SSUT18 TaxID=3040602 RepID=UPI002447C095|nr:helix-turn-helix domain containing protein [Bradyrhizobium sp. SSUT18]MDH2401832.1 helix-turn-helix domain containing protein [Bradyrhizobium sp. SSUT18]